MAVWVHSQDRAKTSTFQRELHQEIGRFGAPGRFHQIGAPRLLLSGASQALRNQQQLPFSEELVFGSVPVQPHGCLGPPTRSASNAHLSIRVTSRTRSMWSFLQIRTNWSPPLRLLLSGAANAISNSRCALSSRCSARRRCKRMVVWDHPHDRRKTSAFNTSYN